MTSNRKQSQTTTYPHWQHNLDRKGGLPRRNTGSRTRAKSNKERAIDQNWNAGDQEPATNKMETTSKISCKRSRWANHHLCVMAVMIQVASCDNDLATTL